VSSDRPLSCVYLVSSSSSFLVPKNSSSCSCSYRVPSPTTDSRGGTLFIDVSLRSHFEVDLL
jgi:hypothetical protein